jgi:predicted DCC family thiol-disulfide oxidoreductase YuxK
MGTGGIAAVSVSRAWGRLPDVNLRERPVLLYDGECGLCTRVVSVALRLPADFDVRPWQGADLSAFAMSQATASQAVQWVDVDNSSCAGHLAVAAMLRASGGLWALLGRTMLLPGISAVAARAYEWVSANRGRARWPISATPACQRPAHRRPGRND